MVNDQRKQNVGVRLSRSFRFSPAMKPCLLHRFVMVTAVSQDLHLSDFLYVAIACQMACRCRSMSRGKHSSR